MAMSARVALRIVSEGLAVNAHKGGQRIDSFWTRVTVREGGVSPQTFTAHEGGVSRQIFAGLCPYFLRRALRPVGP